MREIQFYTNLNSRICDAFRVTLVPKPYYSMIFVSVSQRRLY
jgi:hypothetical protein